MNVLPVTKALEETVGDCRYCPKMCRHACPVAEAEASEAATPTWKGTLAHAWMRGELPLAGAVAEAAYKCTDCLLSREACLYRHEVPEPYAAVRTAAFVAGVAPARALSYAERVRRLGNPFEAGLSARLAAIVGPGERATDVLLPAERAADVVLFPGCTAVRHDLDLVRDARAVFARVERAPLRVCEKGGACCGYPLYAAGDLDGFRALAREASAGLSSAREVIALDPGCAHTMSQLWPRLGVRAPARVTTLVERLAERLDAVRAAVRAPIERATFSYHDPCYLGRHRGVYEAPRALLAAACGGRAPVELATSREGAWCSGAGSCYSKVNPPGASSIRDRRLAEHAECGASVLTTACPSARRFLAKGLAAAAPAPLDVVAVLAIAVGARPVV